MLYKVIALEEVEIIAPIGFYKKERIKKNKFLVNISIEKKEAVKDDPDNIKNTVNYEKLFTIVKSEMKTECRLMEDVAQRMFSKIQQLDASLLKINISIRKKDPPLKGKVKYSRVELNWVK